MRKFLLLFLSLALLGVGVRAYPCGMSQASHACCPKISGASLANPSVACCQEVQKKSETANRICGVPINFDFHLIATAVVTMPNDNPHLSLLQTIRNNSPPNVPIYLSQQTLLL